MSNYLVTGGKIRVAPEGSISVEKKLPAATYSIEFSKEEGFFLAPMENMDYDGKIYGNIEEVVDRITKAYTARKRNLGVLLSGIKGSGKSLTMKLLAKKVVSVFNMPAIIVSKAYPAHMLARFLYSIDLNCAVIFDEFDKNYAEKLKNSDNRSEEMDTSSQAGLLDLLDGIYDSQKLFVFCANREMAVSEYMLNRPGRIFYHFRYRQLSMEIIREYLEDNLKNKEFMEETLLYTGFIWNLTFDILKAIVEESNLFNEPVSKFIDNMNVDCDISRKRFKVTIHDPEGNIVKHLNDERIRDNTRFSFYSSNQFFVERSGGNTDKDGDVEVMIPFHLNSITDVKPDGSFMFHDKCYGVTLKFTPYQYEASGLTGSRLGSIYKNEGLEDSLFYQKSEIWSQFLIKWPRVMSFFNVKGVADMLSNDAVTIEEFCVTLDGMAFRMAASEKKRLVAVAAAKSSVS